jgi:hypothetical protein
MQELFNWFERSACTALGHFRQNIAATIQISEHGDVVASDHVKHAKRPRGWISLYENNDTIIFLFLTAATKNKVHVNNSMQLARKYFFAKSNNKYGNCFSCKKLAAETAS